MTIEERTSLIARLKDNLALINKNIDSIEEENPGLTEFVINTTVDRVLLYLNSEVFPSAVERITADVINRGLNAVLGSANGTDRTIASISDNGQTISYTNEVKSYFGTSNDNEFFMGVTSILNRYRKIKVVY